MHYNELDHIHEKIAFLTDIIKANKLHEPTCVAFSLPKDHAGTFGFAASMANGQCHCWLDKDNRAEQGKAFAVYHIENKEILHDAFYVNRHHTREHILDRLPHLSADPKSPDYWGKTYYIIEVTLSQPAESTK